MDLAKFETRYWIEVTKALEGDRAPLIAKLREGVEPTPLDLARLADLFEHKNPRGRPTKRKSVSKLMEGTYDPRALAHRRYDLIMADLKAQGKARGMQAQVNDQVCREFGIEDPKKFARWRGNTRKRRWQIDPEEQA